MVKISTVILAAGASRRLGSNKLCVRVNGEAVIRRTVRLFVETGAGNVIVVTGFEKERVEKELAGLPVIFVHNDRPDDGMSASIKAALPVVAQSDLVFFHLGDKPFVESGVIHRILEMFARETHSIIVPVHGGTKGHPVLIDVRRHLSALYAVDGEGGLRDLIAAHAEDVHFLEAGEGTVLDLDTEEDIELLERRGYTVEKG